MEKLPIFINEKRLVNLLHTEVLISTPNLIILMPMAYYFNEKKILFYYKQLIILMQAAYHFNEKIILF